MSASVRDRAIATFRKSLPADTNPDMSAYQIAKSRKYKTITIRDFAGTVQASWKYKDGKLRKIYSNV